jgi:hypothetical protein
MSTHIHAIKNALWTLRTSQVVNQLHDMQAILATALDQCKNIPIPAVQENIRDIQQLYNHMIRVISPNPVRCDSPNHEERSPKQAKIESHTSPTSPQSNSALSYASAMDNLNHTFTDEAEHLRKFLHMIVQPVTAMKFRPPLRFNTIKDNGEKDEQYWEDILEALQDVEPINTVKQYGITIGCFAVGPQHCKCFIRKHGSFTYYIAPNKATLAHALLP